MEAPRYVRWLIEEANIKLSDGTHIPCYRLDHTKDDDVLIEWALHLRRHYESDESLAESIAEIGLPAAEYLRDYVLPGAQNLAAACRSGDFTEILVSDLLEFVHNYKVPRCKQQNRANKDRSTQGTDIVGYHYANPDGKPSTRDEFIAAEVKGYMHIWINCQVALVNVFLTTSPEMRMLNASYSNGSPTVMPETRCLVYTALYTYSIVCHPTMTFPISTHDS